jgi:hypothetical protein
MNRVAVVGVHLTVNLKVLLTPARAGCPDKWEPLSDEGLTPALCYSLTC